MAKQNALESDRREAFLSRVALRTDYKNGFSLFEFIVQIVEIVALSIWSYLASVALEHR